ncbi:MAG: hypothetical protein RLZZ226_78 [Pseudomonadota bacterium]|jgi:hypothetical protein
MTVCLIVLRLFRIFWGQGLRLGTKDTLPVASLVYRRAIPLLSDTTSLTVSSPLVPGLYANAKL